MYSQSSNMNYHSYTLSEYLTVMHRSRKNHVPVNAPNEIIMQCLSLNTKCVLKECRR